MVGYDQSTQAPVRKLSGQQRSRPMRSIISLWLGQPQGSRPPEIKFRVANGWQTRTGCSELNTVTAVLKRMGPKREHASS